MFVATGRIIVAAYVLIYGAWCVLDSIDYPSVRQGHFLKSLLSLFARYHEIMNNQSQRTLTTLYMLYRTKFKLAKLNWR